MSRVRADTITNKNANGAPNFSNGLTVTAGGVNVTGVVTATSFVGGGINLSNRGFVSTIIFG